jgi:transposase
MSQKKGGYDQSYLKVVASDPKEDIIMGSVISGHDDEVSTALPLFQESNKNCAQAGVSGSYNEVIADSRFVTAANCDDFEQSKAQLTGPTQKHQHQERQTGNQSDASTFDYDAEHKSLCCSEGQSLALTRSFYSSEHDATFDVFSNPEACAKCSRLRECTLSKAGYREVKLDSRYPAAQRSIQRYLSEEGQELYKKRSHVAEVFQGDLKQNGKFIQFLRRGKKKISVESATHDIVWNLRRIFMVREGKIAWGI